MQFCSHFPTLFRHHHDMMAGNKRVHLMWLKCSLWTFFRNYNIGRFWWNLLAISYKIQWSRNEMGGICVNNVMCTHLESAVASFYCCYFPFWVVYWGWPWNEISPSKFCGSDSFINSLFVRFHFDGRQVKRLKTLTRLFTWVIELIFCS